MGVPDCAVAVKGNVRRITAVNETDTYQKHLESVLILNAPRRRLSNRLAFLAHSGRNQSATHVEDVK